MAGVVSALLRAGFAVKLAQLKQATSSYVSDRIDQGRSTLSSYLVGAAFYAAAGVFLIAALLVGAAALFRWVETRYGLYTAFGTVGGALAVLTVICAAIAANAMRPAKTTAPSLGTRLQVALEAAPPKRTADAAPTRAIRRAPATEGDRLASARRTAASILREPPTPRRAAAAPSAPVIRSAGAAAAVGLLGWALARRYSRPSHPTQANRSRR